MEDSFFTTIVDSVSSETESLNPLLFHYHAANMYRSFLCFLLLVFRSFSVLTELAKRGIRLPSVSKPIGNYTSVLRSGNYLYLCIGILVVNDGKRELFR